MRTQGKIATWKGNKGFGFITPDSGAKQVFVHISEFNTRDPRPRPGQIVTFSLSTDNQGRPCAVRVAREGEKIQGEIKRNDALLMSAVAVLFLVAVAILIALNKMPALVLLIYLAVSVVTFIVYAMDKSAAKRGAWRTKEATLHGLSLIGGWPGALIAQQTLRHKSKKEDFRFVFWFTVVVNVAVLVWLLTESGSTYIHQLIG